MSEALRYRLERELRGWITGAEYDGGEVHVTARLTGVVDLVRMASTNPNEVPPVVIRHADDDAALIEELERRRGEER